MLSPDNSAHKAMGGLGRFLRLTAQVCFFTTETKAALCGLNGNVVIFKCKCLRWDRLGTQMTAGKTKSDKKTVTKKCCRLSESRQDMEDNILKLSLAPSPEKRQAGRFPGTQPKEGSAYV